MNRMWRTWKSSFGRFMPRRATGIARGIDVTADARRVVILHVFAKKSQKTPAGALALARQRLRELKP